MTVPTHTLAATRRPWSATLAATAWTSSVLLVLIGSIVRVTGHGLGCPDWPLCYGRAIPPGLAGAWVEFSHRLFGGITAAQVVLLAVLVWREQRDQRRVLRPALLAVGLLAVQVLLGGLHVILEIPPQTGLVHTGVAMLLVGALAVVLTELSEPGRRLALAAQDDFIPGRSSASSPRLALPRLTALADLIPGSDPAPPSRRALALSWLTALAALATYLLLLTGSLVTRSGASLACLSFPLCGPVGRATRQLVEIHMLHRLAAFVVGALTVYLLVRILRQASQPALRRFAYAIAGLLALQLALGILNVALLLPAWTRVLHLTVGATFWSAMAALWRITRLIQRGDPSRDRLHLLL